MNNYKSNNVNYEIFELNMTLNTESNANFEKYLLSCKSCQCNCRLCRGGKMVENDLFDNKFAKDVLENLLKE